MVLRPTLTEGTIKPVVESGNHTYLGNIKKDLRQIILNEADFSTILLIKYWNWAGREVSTYVKL